MFVLSASFLACFSDTSSLREPALHETGTSTKPGLKSYTISPGKPVGDPETRPGVDRAPDTDNAALTELDVVVMGSGPAGLTAA